jgi:DNA adenine methylase
MEDSKTTKDRESNVYRLEKEKEYLSTYLQTIKGKKTYKRVSLSPLRYAGGKSKAVGLILENLPALKNKRIVSPFFGGGSLEIVLSQQLGYEVIGYDIFNLLVNFWQHIIQTPDALAEELEKLVPTKEEFTRNRHILLNYWNQIKPTTLNYKTRKLIQLNAEEQTRLDANKLKQAAYYYYNMQLSYGPMFLGWPSSVYLKPEKYSKIIKNVRDFKAGNLRVSCDTFENVLANHAEDFLFLDPPYYLGGDSKMFKGMYPNCNFAIHHNNFDHHLLCELLKKHRGGFLITYNDCPTIRDMYKDYKQIYPRWQYTYGQGETRIGHNRRKDTSTNVKQSHEIFIICPPQES